MKRTPGVSILAVTVLLAGLLVFLVDRIPLAPLSRTLFISSYGITDNRRLLLRYAAILVAVLFSPVFLVRKTGEDLSARASTFNLADPPPRTRTSWLFSALGAAFLFFLFVGPGIAYRAINGHEMVHFGYLNEIAHGRLLNVETRITYGPLLGYSMFAFMKLVSFTLYGFRLYWNVVTALFLTALLFAARRWIRAPAMLLLMGAYLVLHTAARYYLPDSGGLNGGFWGWGNVARHGWVSLLILALAAPLIRSRDSAHRSRFRRAIPWIAAGALYTIGSCYAQDTAPAAFIAIGALMLVVDAADLRGLLRRDAPLALAGALGAWILIHLPVILRGALGPYWTASSEVPGLFFQGAGNLPYPSILGQDHSGHPALVPYYLLPSLLLLLLLASWVDLLRFRRFAPVEFPLAVYAALSYVSVLVRADLPHLLNASVTSILLLFLFVDRRRRTGSARGKGLVRWLTPLALLLPLVLFRPGLPHFARVVVARALHANPRPPGGWRPLPSIRAGIWTPAGDWFDSAQWGEADDPAAISMIQRLTEGGETFIEGHKSSLYYFLTGSPAAVPYTDISSQCFTPEDYARLGESLARRRPEYVFVMPDSPGARPGAANHYRALGLHHGFLVFQRDDLPAIDAPRLEGADPGSG